MVNAHGYYGADVCYFPVYRDITCPVDGDTGIRCH